MSDEETGPGEHARLLAQDFGLYSVGMAVPAALEIVAVVLFTRLFAPDAYGRYALAMVGATVALAVTSGWIRQAILRFDPNEDRDRVTGAAILGTLAVSVLALAVGTVGYLLLAGRLGPYRPFYLAALGLLVAKGAFATVRTLFQSRLDAATATAARIVQAIARFAVAVLLGVYVLGDIVGWLWGGAAGSAVALAFLWWRSRGQLRVSWPDRRLLTRMASFGFPLVGWLLATSLLTFADRALLAAFSGSAAVGIYASNYDLAMRGLALLFAPFLQAAHPILMNAWDGDGDADVARLVSRFTRYFLVVGGLATTAAIVLSRSVTTLMLGAQFREGYAVVALVAIGQYLWYASMIGHKGLEIREQTSLMFVGVVATLACNVVLNVPLIIHFGYLGAAVATVLSYGVYAGFAYRASRRAIPWRIPRETVRNVAAAGAAMGLPAGLLWATGTYTVASGLTAAILGGGLYGLTLYALGEIRPGEIEAGREAIRDVALRLGAGETDA